MFLGRLLPRRQRDQQQERIEKRRIAATPDPTPITMFRCYNFQPPSVGSATGREGKRRKYPVDPTLHFSERTRSGTVTVPTRAVAPAWCAVQKVLLHPEAGIHAELGRLTGEDAVRVVAGPGVVVGRYAAHNSLALLVAGRALTAGTLEAARAVCSVGRYHVVGTYGTGPGAFLLRIALPVTFATHCICRRKLAAHATILVRVANRVRQPRVSITRPRPAIGELTRRQRYF